MISDNAIKMINAIKTSSLLSCVGNAEKNHDIRIVSTWHEAVKRALSKEWYNFRIDQSNRLTEQLSLRHDDEYSARWNVIANTSRVMLDPIVEAAIARVDERMTTKKRARQQLFISIRVDLMGAIHEVEFDSLVRVQFYRTILSQYLSGFLPCGWEGTFPRGRPIIF